MLAGLALELSPLDDQVVNAIARVLRTVRLVRLLRAAELVRATRRLLRTLLLCASNLLNTTLLLVLLVFIYAVRTYTRTSIPQLSLAFKLLQHLIYSDCMALKQNDERSQRAMAYSYNVFIE